MAREIKLEFKNYKLLKDKSFDLSEHNVVVFEGGNGRGKSSAITGLEELISVMSFTTQPVTQGQQEGSKRVTWEGIDGKMYTIEHTFDVKNGKGKFIAFDDEAKPIKSVTKIRELIGQYSRLTVEEFFEKAKTVPGRKKLVDEYFNKLLTAGEQEEIRLAKAYHDEAYNQRTEFGNKLKILKPQIVTISEEDQKILDRRQEAADAITLREGQLRDYSDLQFKVQRLNDWKTKVHIAHDDIHRECEALGLDWNPETLASWLDETVGAITKKIGSISLPDKEDLETRLGRAREIVDKCNTLEGSLGRQEDVKSAIEETEDSYALADSMVKKKKQEIKDVYTNSKLPGGLTIEEEGFSLDGFDLSKEQVSESQVKLAIAEMMCQIDTSGLIVMGNAAVFGKDRLDALYDLAKNHNKIVFLERVVDEVTDIRAVGIIEAGENVKFSEAGDAKAVPAQDPDEQVNAHNENNTPDNDPL